MFAADGAAPGNDLREKFIQRGFGALLGARLGQVHHDVGVDVAVAGVAETGDGQAVFLLQPGGELEQVFQPAARHDDVFVELGQAGVAEGVGKFAADFPDGFALGGAQAALDEQRFLPADDSFQVLDLAADGFFLAVQFDNQMGAATAQAFAPGAFVGGGEREFIGQLQRAWQETGGQDGLQRAHGVFHGTETRRPGWPGTAAAESTSAWLR